MPGIEPGASYMQSMRSTTELHPLAETLVTFLDQIKKGILPKKMTRLRDFNIFSTLFETPG